MLKLLSFMELPFICSLFFSLRRCNVQQIARLSKPVKKAEELLLE
jgi:hypothetical protein